MIYMINLSSTPMKIYIVIQLVDIEEMVTK